MRRRVVFLVGTLDAGGAERVLLNWARHLTDAGWEVSFVCLYRPGRLAEEAARLGRLECVGVPTSGGLAAGLAALPRVAGALTRARAPIVQAFHLVPWGLGAVIGRLSRERSLVASVQNMPPPPTMKRSILLRLAARWTDHIVACCRTVRAAFLRDYRAAGERVSVIYNSVDDEAFVEPLSGRRRNGTLVIGTVAHLTPQKGHAHLIGAAVDLKRRGLDFDWRLIGAGALRGELEREVERCGVTDCIRFYGFRSDVRALLGELDLFVLPSLWEGLPVAVLEAMAAGVPVIATDVGGNAELIEHGVTGLMVPPAHPSALADAVTSLACDADARSRMAEAARATVKARFTVRVAGEQLVSVYEGLL
jgi:glycosyltransferase involved in cell wall biosynthesis